MLPVEKIVRREWHNMIGEQLAVYLVSAVYSLSVMACCTIYIYMEFMDL